MPGGSKIPINIRSRRNYVRRPGPDYRGAVLSNWIPAADVPPPGFGGGMCSGASPEPSGRIAAAAARR